MHNEDLFKIWLALREARGICDESLLRPTNRAKARATIVVDSVDTALALLESEFKDRGFDPGKRLVGEEQ